MADEVTLLARELPEVVNRHWYHGRPKPPKTIYIGRGTPLGNPFTVAEHGLDALKLYRKWLWKQIREGDEAVLRAMRAIDPQTHLMCSCKPRPCHGDVVVRAWAWMREQGLLTPGADGRAPGKAVP